MNNEEMKDREKENTLAQLEDLPDGKYDQDEVLVLSENPTSSRYVGGIFFALGLAAFALLALASSGQLAELENVPFWGVFAAGGIMLLVGWVSSNCAGRIDLILEPNNGMLRSEHIGWLNVPVKTERYEYSEVKSLHFLQRQDADGDTMYQLALDLQSRDHVPLSPNWTYQRCCWDAQTRMLETALAIKDLSASIELEPSAWQKGRLAKSQCQALFALQQNERKRVARDGLALTFAVVAGSLACLLVPAVILGLQMAQATALSRALNELVHKLPVAGLLSFAPRMSTLMFVVFCFMLVSLYKFLVAVVSRFQLRLLTDQELLEQSRQANRTKEEPPPAWVRLAQSNVGKKAVELFLVTALYLLAWGLGW